MERDPFEVLGIQHGADPAVAAAAYKALCKKYHPDLNPDDKEAAEKIKEINSAYAAIKSGDYKDEAYYHPEWQQTSQNTAQSTHGPSSYESERTYINVDPYLNNNPPREPNPGQNPNGSGQKKIWTYNGVEMPLWKALLHRAWDRWLSQALLYIIIPVIILLILVKVFTGHSFTKDAKDSGKSIQKSLTQQNAMISMERLLPDTVSDSKNTYQVIYQ